MPEVLQLRKELKTRWRIVFWTMLVLYGIVLTVAFWAWHDANSKRDAIRQEGIATQRLAVRTDEALCTLRASLIGQVEAGAKQVAASQDFLTKHPNGISGISRADIQASITNQQQAVTRQQSTINALVKLDCPPLVKAGP